MHSKAESPGLPPADAIRFFREKGLKPSFDYRDTWRQEHAVAFTVAKAATVDVLQDIRNAVDSSLSEGKTFEQFQKELRPALESKGWWGRKEVTDPKTGNKEIAQLGSPRRLRKIFNTNMRTARAAGQWERAQRTKQALPYFLYQLGPSEVHREAHVALEGTLLPVDDPFWDTHYPPNGWGCKCWLRQVSKRQRDKYATEGVPVAGEPELDDQGRPTGHVGRRTIPAITKAPAVKQIPWENKRTGTVEMVPEGIDPGWDGNPGKDRMRAFVPPPSGGTGIPESFPPAPSGSGSKPPMPPPTPWKKPTSPPSSAPELEIINGFLDRFGATIGRSTEFRDVTGFPINISEELFRNRKQGRWKIKKNNRHLYLPMLAEALEAPDEIWLRWEKRGANWYLQRYYLRRFVMAGNQAAGMAVFRFNQKEWSGVTLFQPEHEGDPAHPHNYIDSRRGGLLIYQKK